MALDQAPAAAGRPRIKICGVTSVDDALLAARLGADLIGLNFHPPSPRCLDPERARSIVAALDRAAGQARGRRRPLVAGVFVDQTPERIAATVTAVGLDLVQLHGDEDPSAVRRFAGRAIKALRTVDRFDAAAARPFLRGGADGAPWAFLIDYRHPRLAGGTGRSWAFASLAGVDLGCPMLIAGGLGPDNVRSAAEASGAWGVDVCSGVESAPGVKDPALLSRFFQETAHVTRAAAS